MKKVAIQLCYFGRGAPASIAHLRQDDYFITFYYFDFDGDLVVLDSVKEFTRVLVNTVENCKEQIKFKADVISKPDRILGTSNSIDSTIQLCDVMYRKVKAKQLSASNQIFGPLSSTFENIAFQRSQSHPKVVLDDNIRTITTNKARPISKKQSERCKLNEKLMKTPMVQSSMNKELLPLKQRESIATKCNAIAINDRNATNTVAATDDKVQKRSTCSPVPNTRTIVSKDDVNYNNSSNNNKTNCNSIVKVQQQRLLSVLPGYYKRKNSENDNKHKVVSMVDVGTKIEHVVNATDFCIRSQSLSPPPTGGPCVKNTTSEIASAHLALIDSSSLSVYTDNNNDNEEFKRSFSLNDDNIPTRQETVDEYESLIGSIDMWQMEPLTSQDDDDIDNVSTHVFFQESTGQVSI
jgi:hypothetical protein